MSQRHPVWVAENHVNPCNSVLIGSRLVLHISCSFHLHPAFSQPLARPWLNSIPRHFSWLSALCKWLIQYFSLTLFYFSFPHWGIKGGECLRGLAYRTSWSEHRNVGGDGHKSYITVSVSRCPCLVFFLWYIHRYLIGNVFEGLNFLENMLQKFSWKWHLALSITQSLASQLVIFLTSCIVKYQCIIQ